MTLSWRTQRGICGFGIAVLCGCGWAGTKRFASDEAAQTAGPPALVLGSFSDDYGNAFRLSPTLFEQLPRNRFHIVEWNATEQYFVARNDSTNPTDARLWTRFDWMPFDGMAPYTWGFCLTAWRAPTRDAARATPPPNRATPRAGCNGFPFSRMKPD